VALRGRRILEERIAEDRREEIPRALHLRHIELDVIDRIELESRFLRGGVRRREHPGSDGVERLPACQPLHARNSLTHSRRDPLPWARKRSAQSWNPPPRVSRLPLRHTAVILDMP